MFECRLDFALRETAFRNVTDDADHEQFAVDHDALRCDLDRKDTAVFALVRRLENKRCVLGAIEFGIETAARFRCAEIARVELRQFLDGVPVRLRRGRVRFENAPIAAAREKDDVA